VGFVLLTAPVFQLLGVLPLPISVIRTVLELFVLWAGVFIRGKELLCLHEMHHIVELPILVDVLFNDLVPVRLPTFAGNRRSTRSSCSRAVWCPCWSKQDVRKCCSVHNIRTKVPKP
jgi:hypothetical protein